MDTTKWIARVAGAADRAQVIDLVNQYVATRDPALLAALPAECRIGALRTPDEIIGCAYRLSAYHGHDEASRVVQRLSSFFAQASARLAELAREG